MMKGPALPILALLLAGCVSAPPPQPASREAGAPAAPAESAAIPSRPAEERPEASLPIPQGEGAAALRPSPVPVPPELSAYEALRQAARLLPRELKLLTVGGRVPLLLHELSGDGNPECLAMAVRGQELKPADLEALSQSSRLFDSEAPAVGFVLLFYGNSQGSLRRPQVIDLGERQVFESLKRTSLYKNRSNPLIVTVSFLNLDGREQVLLVFDGASGVPRYRTMLKESLAIRSWLEDIDGDGILDILTRERALEEGFGYETFLSWSRWNGRAFLQVESRNVLRSLRGYLETVRRDLFAGDERALLELATEARELQRLRARGMSERAALLHLLGLDSGGLAELPRIREVVFPEILEDPFITQDRFGSFFPLTYRITDENGTVYLLSTRLYMLHNPFGERQFALRPAGD
jgi:hypothetical protein